MAGVGIAAGLGAGALWGLVFVVPRVAPGVGAVDWTAGRFVSFGLVAALALLWRGRRQPRPTGVQALAALGLSLLGATGYYTLLAQSVVWAGTEVPTLIIGTIPVWVMQLGKPRGLRWAALWPGLALTACGLALMMQAALAGAGPALGLALQQRSQFWPGVALALAAMLSWTAYALLNAAWLKRHPHIDATTWTNWQGVATGLGAGLLWLLLGSSPAELAALDGKPWIALACVATGFGSAWLAGILWNVASQRLSVSLCGQLIVSETLFALLYSFAWDGAWPSAAQATAAVLFVLGILASIRAHP
ncbi:MAG: DMT family transporter [Rhodoferax sp.]